MYMFAFFRKKDYAWLVSFFYFLFFFFGGGGGGGVAEISHKTHTK